MRRANWLHAHRLLPRGQYRRVLAQRYRAHIISTSKLAAQFLHSYASRRPFSTRLAWSDAASSVGASSRFCSASAAEFVFLMDDSSVEDLVDRHTFLFGPSHDLDLLDAAEPAGPTSWSSPDNLARPHNGGPHPSHQYRLPSSAASHDDSADVLGEIRPSAATSFQG